MTQLFALSTLLAQLWLVFLAAAAPVADDIVSSTSHAHAWEYGTSGGIIGVIVLILDLIVFGRSTRQAEGALPCPRQGRIFNTPLLTRCAI